MLSDVARRGLLWDLEGPKHLMIAEHIKAVANQQQKQELGT